MLKEETNFVFQQTDSKWPSNPFGSKLFLGYPSNGRIIRLKKGWGVMKPKEHAQSIFCWNSFCPNGPAGWTSSHGLVFQGKNMAPTMYTPRLKVWPRGGYLQEIWMDLHRNAHEASDSCGWCWSDRKKYRPGVGNPYAAHSHMELHKAQ